MNNVTTTDCNIAQYEFRISVNAAAADVWDALLNRTNDWWLAEFRMSGPDSTVHFDARAGGGIREEQDGYSQLEWYSVQWIRPHELTVYLTGHLAADWGGPAITQMKISLESTTGKTSVIVVHDSLIGAVSESTAGSLQSGWTQLFTALKHWIEGQP